MSEKFFLILEEFDQRLTQNINAFFANYYPSGNLPFLSLNLPLITKITIYTIIALLPVGIGKILYPYSKFINVLFVVCLTVLGAGVAGIFLGFLQILFI